MNIHFSVDRKTQDKIATVTGFCLMADQGDVAAVRFCGSFKKAHKLGLARVVLEGGAIHFHRDDVPADDNGLYVALTDNTDRSVTSYTVCITAEDERELRRFVDPREKREGEHIRVESFVGEKDIPIGFRVYASMNSRNDSDRRSN